MSDLGMRSVFYSDNAKAKSQELDAAVRAIKSRNLTPVSYVNVTSSTRSSSVDRQVRDSYYRAVAVCLFFRQNGNDWFAIADHWAIEELAHTKSRCFIYLAATVVGATENLVRSKISASCQIRKLNTADDLGLIIAGDLKSAGV